MLRQRGIRPGGHLRHEEGFLGGGNRPRTPRGAAGGQVAGGPVLPLPAGETGDADVKEMGDLSRRQARPQGPQRPLTEVDGIRARHGASASLLCGDVNLFAIRSRPWAFDVNVAAGLDARSTGPTNPRDPRVLWRD